MVPGKGMASHIAALTGSTSPHKHSALNLGQEELMLFFLESVIVLCFQSLSLAYIRPCSNDFKTEINPRTNDMPKLNS